MKTDTDYLLERCGISADDAINAVEHLSDIFGPEGWTLRHWRDRLEDNETPIALDARASEVRAALAWARAEVNGDEDSDDDDEEGGYDE